MFMASFSFEMIVLSKKTPPLIFSPLVKKYKKYASESIVSESGIWKLFVLFFELILKYVFIFKALASLSCTINPCFLVSTFWKILSELFSKSCISNCCKSEGRFSLSLNSLVR